MMFDGLAERRVARPGVRAAKSFEETAAAR
jgi:hypothetical protein